MSWHHLVKFNYGSIPRAPPPPTHTHIDDGPIHGALSVPLYGVHYNVENTYICIHYIFLFIYKNENYGSIKQYAAIFPYETERT